MPAIPPELGWLFIGACLGFIFAIWLIRRGAKVFFRQGGQIRFHHHQSHIEMPIEIEIMPDYWTEGFKAPAQDTKKEK